MDGFVPKVIFPLIILGSLLISAKAAIGIPQLAIGPQKCVLKHCNSLYKPWKCL